MTIIILSEDAGGQKYYDSDTPIKLISVGIRNLHFYCPQFSRPLGKVNTKPTKIQTASGQMHTANVMPYNIHYRKL